jgi:hypothetical protein
MQVVAVEGGILFKRGGCDRIHELVEINRRVIQKALRETGD